jgi:type VI secretion system protein ImpI
MALKLTILTPQREQLGALSSIVFGVGGGGIGRASDNDWVLPDPQRYLSAHHARIQFRNGAYLLLDTSTNGVYLNDDAAPIGRRSTHQLRDGDILRFGNYQVAVSIDMEPAQEAPEASSIFPVGTRPFSSEPVAGRTDIGASLQVHDLLNGHSNNDSASTRVSPMGAFGQAPLTEDPALLAFDSGLRSGPNRLLKANGAHRQGRSAERAAENLAGVDAFCRGAGIDPKELPPDAPARLLHLAGVLLREALVGLKGLALSQRELREQTHIEVGKEDLQHIGLTGLPVEDLLLRLLLGHERRDLDAVLWVREVLSSARRHDVATIAALHSALTEFIAHLEPPAAAPAKSTAKPASADSSSLTARFRTITEMPGGALPHLYVESFARAFIKAYRQHHIETP